MKLRILYFYLGKFGYSRDIIDVYQQTRDQDFLALFNCSKGDLETNQSKASLLDRLRGDKKRSPADIQSVLSISLSRPAEKNKNVTFVVPFEQNNY